MFQYFHQEEGKKNPNWYLLYFLLGFMLGAIWFQFRGKFVASESGLFSYAWIEVFLNVQIESGQLFWFCFCKRFPVLLFLLIMGMTKWRKYFISLFLGICGALFAIDYCVAAYRLGLNGFLQVFCMLFPHYIFYVIAFVLYLKWCDCEVYHNVRKWQFFFLILLFVIGLLMESYVNPIILHKILKKIY